MQSPLAAKREKARPLYRAALALAPRVKPPDAPYSVPLHVAHLHTLMGDRAGARNAIATAKKAALAKREYWAVAAAPVITEQLRAGDVAGARKSAEAIGDPAVRVTALIEIATARYKNGDRAGAVRTLADARKVAAGTDDSARHLTLEAVAIAQLETKDLAGLRVTLPPLQRAANARTDPNGRAYGLGVVAGLMAKVGDRAGAKATFARAIRDAESPAARDPNPDYNARILINLGTLQAGADDRAGARATFTRARKALERVKRLPDRADVQAFLAVSEVDSEEPESARSDFASAEKWADACDDPDERFQALLRVAEHRGEAGDRAGQWATLRKARQAALADPDPNTFPFSLTEVGVEQAKAGDFDGARETARAIPLEDDRVHVLLAVGTEQAKAGDRASARKSLEAVAPLCRDEGPRTELAAGWAWAGDAAASARVAATLPDPLLAFLAHYETVRILTDPTSPAVNVPEPIRPGPETFTPAPTVPRTVPPRPAGGDDPFPVRNLPPPASRPPSRKPRS